MIPMRVPFASFTLAVCAAVASAQVPAGAAVVLGEAPTLLRVVDSAGTATTITSGLDPATQAARSLCVTSAGLVAVGLSAANAGAGANLDLRLLVLNGSTAVDVPFATLMAVPAGEEWAVFDIKERDDGDLLVLATQVVLTSNPIAASAVFLVDPGGVVQQVPAGGAAIGVPMAIADLGDRYALAVDQAFFVRNVQLQALDFNGVAPPIEIAQLFGVGSFGGFDRDVSGELVFGATFGGSTSSVHRVLPVAGAAPVPVPGGPSALGAGHVNRAGILSSVSFLVPSTLARTDTVLGGTASWAALAGPAHALAVRDNPAVYGLSLTPPLAAVGCQGGPPTLPNPQWGLRIHDPAATPAIVFVGGGPVPTQQASPFGTLLVDPAFGITGFGFFLTSGPPVTASLPLPADPGLAGVPFHFQALIAPVSGAPAFLTSALAIELQL